MAKENKTETTSTSNSATRPWEESMPVVNKIIGQLGQYDSAPTTAQTTAGDKLVTAAGGIPDLSGSEIGAVKNLFSSNSQPQQDMLTGAYADLKKNLSGYLDPSYLDPMKTPGLSDALATMKGDISNSVNGSFAAAGRDFSPANSTYLSRGLSQGMGGLIADQFNKNVAANQGAAGAVFSGAGSTASGVNNLKQTDLGNGVAGLSAASGLGGLLTAPALAQLSAANTRAALPLQNLSLVEQLGLPVAALGSNTTGNSHGTTTKEEDPTKAIIGGLLGGAGMLMGGPMGGMMGSSLGGLLGGGGGGGPGFGVTSATAGSPFGMMGGIPFPMAG